MLWATCDWQRGPTVPRGRAEVRLGGSAPVVQNVGVLLDTRDAAPCSGAPIGQVVVSILILAVALFNVAALICGWHEREVSVARVSARHRV